MEVNINPHEAIHLNMFAFELKHGDVFTYGKIYPETIIVNSVLQDGENVIINGEEYPAHKRVKFLKK